MIINSIRKTTLLLTLSALVVASFLRADIVYTSTNIVCFGEDVFLDIDSDETNDFRFINRNTIVSKMALLEQRPGSLIHVSTNGINGAPLPLGYHLESPNINSNLWLTHRDVAVPLFSGHAESMEEMKYSGLWANVTNQCVGVALRKGDTYLCGWLLLTIDSGIIYLHGYAYENNPEQSIYTGRTSSYPGFTGISCSQSNAVLLVDNLIPGQNITIQKTKSLNAPTWSYSSDFIAQGLNTTFMIPITNDVQSTFFRAVMQAQ
ncbi:MAG: hypothetical protein PF692_09910 [Kiritimatiellae bacterium]|nr:hypothetical protein [Kiritimatiellia bacterium]